MNMIQRFYRPGEEPSGEPYHYTSSGLDNIYLLNGFTKDEEDGEPTISIADLDGLHRAIGLHIALARKAPSGRELRFLRNEMDMSQAELARILGVTDQSVARWEKGQTEFTGAAVFALRVLYLINLIPETERPPLLDGLLKRLNKLAERDEISDRIVLSYCGDRWFDKVLEAA